MKKIYSTLLVAACVLGASAQTQQIDLSKFQTRQLKAVNRTEVATLSTEKPLSTLRISREDILGDWDWNYTSAISGGSEAGSVTIKAGEQSNEIVLEMQYENGLAYKVTGTVTAMTNRITIPKQQVGTNEAGSPIYFITTDNSLADTESISGTFDSDTRITTFTGFMVIATEAGWAQKQVYNAARQSTFEPLATWTEYPNCKFKETFVSPMYNIPLQEQTITVKVKDTAPNVFRIVNPLAIISEGEITGFVDVDATDPEYVLVPFTDTGFNDPEDGPTYIVSQSYALANMVQNTLDKAAFIAQRGAYNITMDPATLEITFPSQAIFCIWPETTSETSGTSPNTFYGAPVHDPGYLKIDKTTLGAIGNVAVDADVNAPVEFFNLQGQKVVNPEAGQVLIRRQGSKATKIFVK